MDKNIDTGATWRPILIKISSNVRNWHLINCCKFHMHRHRSFEIIKTFLRGDIFFDAGCKSEL